MTYEQLIEELEKNYTISKYIPNMFKEYKKVLGLEFVVFKAVVYLSKKEIKFIISKQFPCGAKFKGMWFDFYNEDDENSNSYNSLEEIENDLKAIIKED